MREYAFTDKDGSLNDLIGDNAEHPSILTMIRQRIQHRTGTPAIPLSRRNILWPLAVRTREPFGEQRDQP